MGLKELKKFFLRTTGIYIYLILIITWAIFGIFSPKFLSADNLLNIFKMSVPILLVTLGQTMVILSGGWDLSVGPILSIGTAVASLTMIWNVGLSIALVLVVGLSLGILNGVLISKLKIEPFIVTFSMMFTFMGIAQILRPHPGGYIAPSFINVLLYKISGFPIVLFLIFLITIITGLIIFYKRNFGRQVYALGGAYAETGKFEMARKVGIKTDRVIIMVFAFSGLMASIAGLIVSGYYASGSPLVGSPYTFDSITAAFMGGTVVSGIGGFIGSIGAVFILASIGRILNLTGVSVWYEFVIRGVLLIVVYAVIVKLMHRRTPI